MRFRISSRQTRTLALAMASFAALATVRAQSGGDPGVPTLGYVCNPSGLTGCYDCVTNPSPAGAGCANTNLGGYTPGSCGVGMLSDSCMDNSLNCGAYSTCASPPVQVGNCTTLALCISGNPGP